MLICNGLFSFPVLLWHIPGSNTAGARLWVFWAMVLQHSMTATTNMGSHVRKIRFTLAFSIADLRGPRKNYLLRPASASIVRRGFGPWPQWQREGSVMFLSKRQFKEIGSNTNWKSLHDWMIELNSIYYSQQMCKCGAMMLCPVLTCGKVASFDG